MARCEKLNACPFYQNRLPNMPSVSGLLKNTYCFSDKSACARYQVEAAGLVAPVDLLPNDRGRALTIIAGF